MDTIFTVLIVVAAAWYLARRWKKMTCPGGCGCGCGSGCGNGCAPKPREENK